MSWWAISLIPELRQKWRFKKHCEVSYTQKIDFIYQQEGLHFNSMEIYEKIGNKVKRTAREIFLIPLTHLAFLLNFGKKYLHLIVQASPKPVHPLIP